MKNFLMGLILGGLFFGGDSDAEETEYENDYEDDFDDDDYAD